MKILSISDERFVSYTFLKISEINFETPGREEGEGKR